MYFDRKTISNPAANNRSDSILKLDVMKACNFVRRHSIKAAIEDNPVQEKTDSCNILICFIALV